jgi:hypothetical protein
VSFRSPSEYDRSGPCSASRPRRLSRVCVPSALEEAGSDSSGFTTPGFAAPSGFRTLLTPCSSRNPPAIFQTGNAPGIAPFEGFPFHGTALTSRQRLPAWRWLERARRPEPDVALARLPGFLLRGSPLSSQPIKRRVDPCLPWACAPSRGFSPSATASAPRRGLLP